MVPQFTFFLQVHDIIEYPLDFKNIFFPYRLLQFPPILINFGLVPDRQLSPPRDLLGVGSGQDRLVPPVLVIEPIVHEWLDLLPGYEHGLRDYILHDLGLLKGGVYVLPFFR